MSAYLPDPHDPRGIAPAAGKRVAVWVMLSVLAALVGWFAFRAYLNPELLFHFANSLVC